MRKAQKLPKLTETEQIVYERLVAMGCVVYRHGWPDFLCRTPGGKIVAIEVKKLKTKFRNNGDFRVWDESLKADSLSPAQEDTIECLEQAGLRCYVAQAHPDGLIRDIPESFD